MRKISLKLLLLSPILLFLITTIGLFIYIVSETDNLIYSSNQDSKNILIQDAKLFDINDNLAEARRLLTRYIYTRDNEFKKPINLLLESLNKLTEQSSNYREIYKDLNNEILKYNVFAKDMLNDKDKELDELQYKKFHDDFTHTGNNIDKIIVNLKKSINESSRIAVLSFEKESNKTKKTVITLIVISILISLAISLKIILNIIKVFSNINYVMDDVSKGNLEHHLDDKGDNEIYQLNKAINQTLFKLKTTIAQLNSVGLEVATAATELSQITANSQESAERQLNEITLVATAVNELSATAGEVRDNAASAETKAQEINTITEEALTIFDQSSVAFNEVIHSLDSLSKTVVNVSDKSEEIRTIVDTIGSISEQTNLLALNAAIEAARAGESGRGFAVVADEVRILAKRTSDSTYGIQTIIEDLRSQAEIANKGMNQSLELVDSVQSINKQVDNSLKKVQEACTEISDINSLVATASEEQSQVSNEINSNLTNISDNVALETTAISQSSSASLELSNLAEKQKESLDFFKIDK
ncbi:methyl-accepting chemotaxis protein [Aliivibrio fischeri ES114]|uniref:Methyl-accepting chemotaxis protein n=1 Tax=Aliivibrio fischeri (strain ATCC 700601 / ES114) TaxID=312309 RepID=Q5DYK7_ALIF1|nr:methyl-accepting chemotaxis protein [Aliivibrio fischeri]AAW88139.1 methyl-accepting chemotaxis protein [Aliivibrio fischeri ES114]